MIRHGHQIADGFRPSFGYGKTRVAMRIAGVAASDPASGMAGRVVSLVLKNMSNFMVHGVPLGGIDPVDPEMQGLVRLDVGRGDPDLG